MNSLLTILASTRISPAYGLQETTIVLHRYHIHHCHTIGIYDVSVRKNISFWGGPWITPLPQSCYPNIRAIQATGVYRTLRTYGNVWHLCKAFMQHTISKNMTKHHKLCHWANSNPIVLLHRSICGQLQFITLFLIQWSVNTLYENSPRTGHTQHQYLPCFDLQLATGAYVCSKSHKALWYYARTSAQYIILFLLSSHAYWHFSIYKTDTATKSGIWHGF